jgi:hypothetical protein
MAAVWGSYPGPRAIAALAKQSGARRDVLVG